MHSSRTAINLRKKNHSREKLLMHWSVCIKAHTWGIMIIHSRRAKLQTGCEKKWSGRKFAPPNFLWPDATARGLQPVAAVAASRVARPLPPPQGGGGRWRGPDGAAVSVTAAVARPACPATAAAVALAKCVIQWLFNAGPGESSAGVRHHHAAWRQGAAATRAQDRARRPGQAGAQGGRRGRRQQFCQTHAGLRQRWVQFFFSIFAFVTPIEIF